VSSAQTWLLRSIFRLRSKYGQILWAACLRLVFGLRYGASTPMRFIDVLTCLRPAPDGADGARPSAGHAGRLASVSSGWNGLFQRDPLIYQVVRVPR
jgi:hypothetical protein